MPKFKIQYNTAWGERLVLATKFRKFPMAWNEGNVWTVKVAPKDLLEDGGNYGYLVERDGVTVRCEWDDHRFTPGTKGEIADRWIAVPAGNPFNRKHSAAVFDQPGWRGAGTAVPVFSLRSEKDFGIGEFRDLRPLVDWAASTGQTLIQLLPVNDTTRRGGWEDSYPYSPVSSFALHPLYIHLQDLGIRETAAFKQQQAELNAADELDYPAVFEAKTALLRKAWGRRGSKDLQSESYRKFAANNAFWLDEYAVFCAERDGFDADYYRWLQYHLDLQFSEEVAYARDKGVFFKGDLPIGVSADSADARFHPELFNLDSCAGAPPDFFSADGQNWGFPTYNWEAMARDGYVWWKRRLLKMSQYFDAFRIDHILGFFRIWEIPVREKSGKMGHFNPSLPYTKEEIKAMGLEGTKGLFLPDPRHRGCLVPRISPDTTGLNEAQKQRFDALYNDFFFHRHDAFWKRNAERKLPELLRVTGMLACGEDLGMIPDCVPQVMEHERILSLEMPMMEKGRHWPYLSVCTTSSHDMDTLRMQQEGDRSPNECRQILRGVLASASILAILPLQDWLSLDGEHRRADAQAERINQPADPHHHWRYRLHFNVEELCSLTALNAEISALLADSRRNR
ncbi:MAG: 4-alpha-glucanotransferase [Bacteroidales bacterium]|nr:4-alpha-glucanotransferase [Bacteroidales bacterium]